MPEIVDFTIEDVVEKRWHRLFIGLLISVFLGVITLILVLYLKIDPDWLMVILVTVQIIVFGANVVNFIKIWRGNA